MAENRESFMIYLNGSKRSYRCDCGCNVFHKPEANRYVCNACGVSHYAE